MIKSIPHCITPAKNTSWLHTCNENLLLAQIPDSANNKIQTTLLNAFKKALTVFAEIRVVLKNTNETKSFVDGLYLVDSTKMTRAMNTIKGMGQISASKQSKTYAGAPSVVNLQFFQDILGFPNGELNYLESYLLRYMETIQGHARQATAESLGILTCVVGYVSLTGKTITTFTYVTVTTTTKDKFENIDCGSNNLDKFDYNFNIVKFNY